MADSSSGLALCITVRPGRNKVDRVDDFRWKEITKFNEFHVFLLWYVMAPLPPRALLSGTHNENDMKISACEAQVLFGQYAVIPNDQHGSKMGLGRGCSTIRQSWFAYPFKWLTLFSRQSSAWMSSLIFLQGWKICKQSLSGSYLAQVFLNFFFPSSC